jgi:hypothetical protein
VLRCRPGPPCCAELKALFLALKALFPELKALLLELKALFP